MFARMTRGLTTLALALAIFAIQGPTVLQAQQSGPARVLIPDFFPQADADDDFGKDMAEELREMFRIVPAFLAIERDDIRDVLDRLDMDMEDLNCLFTRQLGPQVNAQVAICASYTESGDMRPVTEIQIIDLQAGTSFPVENVSVDKDDEDVAAQHVVDAFNAYIEQSRQRVFCFDYSSEQNQLWDDALRACTRALELNPGDAGVMYQLAFVKYQTDDLEGALADVETVLELDQLNQDALSLGGFVAAQLGDTEQSRNYYFRYLELNPGDIDTRRSIAYDVAQEVNDAVGAVLIIKEGIEANPEAVGLKADLGNYAFLAARRMLPQGFQPSAENPVPDSVATYYDEAIDAYMQVFEARGDSMDVGQLRNVVVAQVQLNRLDAAASTAEDVLEIFPNETALWATYADVQRRRGAIDDAVAALQRIEELDPEYPNLYARQGSIYLAADRRDDAVQVLLRAVERGGDADQLARQIFSDAYSKGIDVQNWSYALEGITAAKEFPNLSESAMGELNFWHGYSLYQRGIEVCLCGPNATGATVDTAQRAQTMFERAKQFLQMQNSASYAQGRNLEGNRTQIITASDSYIEIQSAIIRRGGGEF